MSERIGIYQAAKELGIAHTTLYEWIKKGCPYTIEPLGMRQVKKVEVSKIKEWMKQQ